MLTGTPRALNLPPRTGSPISEAMGWTPPHKLLSDCLSRSQWSGKCPVFTRITHPSRLNGWCWLKCGLRIQLPVG